jgi:hypothetical protein
MRGSQWASLIRIFLLGVVCILGIGSRRFGAQLPTFIATYAGDTLWALAAFLGIRVLLPRSSTVRVALVAMSFSILIEVSQLYHAPWIDLIRRTTLGGMIIGFDFDGTDLLCYAVGVGMGVLFEGIERKCWPTCSSLLLKEHENIRPVASTGSR